MTYPAAFIRRFRMSTWSIRKLYRMNKELSPADQAQLAEQYRFGMSVLELARQYKMHRQTVAAHLEREGVAVRPQRKMTPRFVERAKKLYAEGQSTTAISKQLGVEASTVGKALKRNGVKLRPPVADRWHGDASSTPSTPRGARR